MIFRSHAVGLVSLAALLGACAAGGDGDELGADGGGGACDPSLVCEELGRTCGSWEDESCGLVDCGGCDDGTCSEQGICMAGEAGPGDQSAELVLLRQTMMGRSDALHEIAKAEARFNDYTPLPTDDRTAYTSEDGERCTVEFDTMYPTYYNGQTWPSKPYRDAGAVSFTAEGAPGPIILETLDLEEDGTAYVHRQQPEPIKQGSTTYSDLVDPSYAQAGASFRIRLEGGREIPTATQIEGRMPEDFQVLEPDIENDAPTVDLTEGLAVRGTPATGPSTMKVYLTSASIAGSMILSCEVADDGELLLPPEAVGGFAYAQMGIMLRREVRHRETVTSEDGQRTVLDIVGRNQRTRAVQTTKQL